MTQVRRRRSDVLDAIEAAARVLASGADGIRQRLLDAYREHLRHVDAAAIPAELADLLVSIRSRFGAGPAADEGAPVEAAIGRMTLADASQLAADIFDLNRALTGSLQH